jgi:hypothetical protein
MRPNRFARTHDPQLIISTGCASDRKTKQRDHRPVLREPRLVKRLTWPGFWFVRHVSSAGVNQSNDVRLPPRLPRIPTPRESGMGVSRKIRCECKRVSVSVASGDGTAYVFADKQKPSRLWKGEAVRVLKVQVSRCCSPGSTKMR